jgi:hypothetical protein
LTDGETDETFDSLSTSGTRAWAVRETSAMSDKAKEKGAVEDVKAGEAAADPMLEDDDDFEEFPKEGACRKLPFTPRSVVSNTHTRSHTHSRANSHWATHSELTPC